MTKRRVTKLAVLGLVLILAAGCATDQEAVKKKSEATRKVGEAYIAGRNYTAALRELLNAEKMFPYDPVLQNDLGLVYRSKGKLDLAIARFKKALEMKPGYAPARNNLGMTYIAARKWDAAIATFKSLTGDLLYATPQYPRFGLGLAYYNKKEYLRAEKNLKAALQYYEDGLRKDRIYILALQGLGLTYLATGRVTAAEKTLEETVHLAPRFADLYFDLGRIYARQKKYDQADYAFTKAIELQPGSELSRRAALERENVRRLKAQ